MAAEPVVEERAERGDAGEQFLPSLVWRVGLPDNQYCGSEVSIALDGAVCPCCIKTKLPVRNLLEEPLLEVLGSLRCDPAYEAISAWQYLATEAATLVSGGDRRVLGA